MSNSTRWSTCEIVCCAIAAVIGLIVLIATREAITFIGALLVGVALGVILYVVLTRLVCTKPGNMAARPGTMATPGASAPVQPEEEPEAEASSPAAETGGAEKVKPSAQPPGEEKPAGRASGRKEQGEAAPGGDGNKPEGLTEARGGQPDDLKQIKGVGPKLEEQLHAMGYYHFDQIAGWGPDEVAWVDENLKGFKGRVSRDNWVEQAKVLAAGGETEFSKRARDGDVY